MKTARDLLQRDLLIPGTGAASETTIISRALNGILGIRLKVVQRYPGAVAGLIALERGEVDGAFPTLEALHTSHPDWLGDGSLNFLFQTRQLADPELAEVPTVMSLAASESQRKDLQFLFPRNAFGRPFAAPPGVPAERLNALQEGFTASVNDPELKAEAEKLHIPIRLTSGQELAATIEEKYAAPADVIERVRRFVPKNDQDWNMKIEKIDIMRADMPQADPKWRFAIHANRVSRGWLIAITSDEGTVGHGYASATKHMGASSEGLKGVLDDFARLLIGRDPFDIEAIMADLNHHLRGMNQAKAAVDCALHEIVARALHAPLCVLFGGKLRSEFPVLRVLSLKAPDEMAAKAQELIDAGYRNLKIKVDGRFELDAARVHAIRRQVGHDIRLTIDANQAYKPKAAIRLANRVADLGVEIFEQPCDAQDHAGLKFVTEHSPIAVEADESAGSLHEVMALVGGRIVDLVSLKIPKLGGLRNTLAAARICEAAGIPCRLGAHVGPRLLTAQAMHLAASLPELSFACEFGEFVRLKNDITQGVENENGMIRLPDGIGSGAGLRKDAGAQMTEAAQVGAL